jgi:hypothetical protein
MNWLNNPLQWTENIPAPSIDPKFEQRLAAIGKEYRLVWGQDFSKARAWNRYQQDWFPKYWFRTIKKTVPTEATDPATGLTIVSHRDEYRMIGVPRFFIEANIPASVAYISGVEKGKDANGDTFAAAHTDPGGEWMALFEVCTHNGTCCATANELVIQCHGNFELPSEATLNMVKAHKRALEAQPDFDPYKPVSEAARAAFHKRAMDAEKERRERLDADMRYAAEHFLNTHIGQLSDDPSVQNNGRFHFLSFNGTGKLTKR